MVRLACGVLCFCALLVIPGCRGKQQPSATRPQTAPAPAMKAAPATPIAEQKEELGGKTWDPAWDVLVEKALPPEMLSGTAARAVAGFCPRFARESEADKRAFWAYVFQAMAGAEAGLEPAITVRHTEAAVTRIDGVSKRPVRQEGLLQLTYDDSDRYGCDFDWERDRKLGLKNPNRTILQPANNLGCGVKIMKRQIIDQKKPMVVKTSYWSTLQPGTKSYQVFKKQMANVPAACGVGVLKPRRKR